MQPGLAVWAKQGSCRYWPCVTRSLDRIADPSLRRRLQEQARKLEVKHPSRRASGASPTEVLVEFLGSHDYAWVNCSKIAPFTAGEDAPDGPVKPTDEYVAAVNRLTGYSGAVQEAADHQRQWQPDSDGAVGLDSGRAPGSKRPSMPAGGGERTAKRRAKEVQKQTSKQQQATSETVAAIAALNAKLAKKMLASKPLVDPAAPLMGRSKRASTAACSRATAQAEMTRQLLQG